MKCKRKIKLQFLLLFSALTCHAQNTMTLTGNVDGTWSLAAMPPYDVKMVVEYEDFVFTAPTAISGLVYTGEAQQIIKPGSSEDGTMVYSLDGVNFSEATPTATFPGTYTVYYKVVGAIGNSQVGKLTVTIGKPTVTYVLANNGNGTWTLDKMPAFDMKMVAEYEDCAFTAPTAISGLVYTGKAQQLVNAGSTEDGTMLYSLDGEKFSEAIPTATLPQAYTVYYKVLGTTGNSQVGKLTAAIEDKVYALTAPTAISGLVYTGEAQQLIKPGSSEDGTMVYSLDGKNFSKAIPTATLPLTYTIYYKVLDSTGHSSQVEKLTATIGKVSYTLANNSNGTYTLDKMPPYDVKVVAEYENYAFTAPTAISGLVYTSKAQQLINAGSTEDGTMVYSLDGENFNKAIPTAIQPQTYTVYYKVVGTTGNSQVGKLTVTIEDKVYTFIAPTAISGLVYTGEAQQIIKPGSSEDGKMVYSLDGENFSEAIPTATLPQTYTVYYKVVDAIGNSQVEKLTATIGKVSYTLTDNGNGTYTLDKMPPYDVKVVAEYEACAFTAPTAISGLVYTGKAQQLIKSGSSEDGTMVYSLDGETFSEAIPTATLPQTYTVYYKVLDSTGHYSQVGKLTVAIEDKVYTFIAPTAISGLVYTGKAQQLIKPGSAEDGTMVYSLDGVNFSETIPTAILPQTYTVYYKVLGTIGNSQVETLTASIGKATFAFADNGNGTWTLDKMPPYDVKMVVEYEDYAFTAPTAISGLVYTDEAQQLIKAGSTDNGTMVYSLDGKKFSEAIPTATLPGTYTVYYKVVGATGNSQVGNLTVTIDKLTVTNVLADNGNGTWSLDKMPPCDVKMVVEYEDYTFTAPTAISDLVYTGEAQQLIKAGSTDDGTIVYSLDGVKFSEAIPTATLPQPYSVYYKVLGTTGNSLVEKLTAAIGKATLALVDNGDGTWSFDKTLPYDVKMVVEYVDDQFNIIANSDGKGNYWATYYNENAGYAADVNTMVYTAKMSANKQKVILKEVDDKVIPAGNAVILKSADANVTMTYAASATGTLDGNELKGSATAVTTPENTYMLVKGANGVGFYHWKGANIPAEKAYLIMNTGVALAREFFPFAEETATDIDVVSAEDDDNDGLFYDLTGRMVAKKPSASGIYIKNGKKVVIK